MSGRSRDTAILWTDHVTVVPRVPPLPLAAAVAATAIEDFALGSFFSLMPF